MRTLNQSTQDVLYNANVHLVAELFTFHFDSGTEYWTSADTDVTSGSITWTCDGPVMITRGTLKASAGVEVDDLELTLVGGTGSLAGTPWALAAVRGDMDGVRVQLHRAFFLNTWGNVVGDLVTVFDGQISEVEPGSAEIKLTVKSAIERMKRPLPFRIVQPQCPYALGDIGCGFNLGISATSAQTLSGSTTSAINVNTNRATDLYNLGVLTITSGPLAGTTRTIIKNTLTGGTNVVTVEPPLPSAPDAGVGIHLTLGCDKKIETCRTKFNNVARYGGFPSMPMNTRS